MGEVLAVGELLWGTARGGRESGDTPLHHAGLFWVWQAGLQVAQCAHAPVSALWLGDGSRPQCGGQYLGESLGGYRRAFGNRRTDSFVKRLGTGDRYAVTGLRHGASRLEEPRTPRIQCGGVSEYVLIRESKIV